MTNLKFSKAFCELDILETFDQMILESIIEASIVADYQIRKIRYDFIRKPYNEREDLKTQISALRYLWTTH